MTQPIKRWRYIEKLIKLKDTKLIKVISGVRRCGKSTLLQVFRDYLLQNGVPPERIITINFEDIQFEELLDYRKLHTYVSDRLKDGVLSYVFFDEIQNVPQFQKALDSLFIKDNTDIYVTGSNAYLLSPGHLQYRTAQRYSCPQTHRKCGPA
jgi:predicted AAA+ superfamily ATPase